MTTEFFRDCSNCGHDSSEHLGVCRTDMFVRASWRKCSCEAFVSDDHLIRTE